MKNKGLRCAEHEKATRKKIKCFTTLTRKILLLKFYSYYRQRLHATMFTASQRTIFWSQSSPTSPGFWWWELRSPGLPSYRGPSESGLVMSVHPTVMYQTCLFLDTCLNSFEGITVRKFYFFFILLPIEPSHKPQILLSYATNTSSG